MGMGVRSGMHSVMPDACLFSSIALRKIPRTLTPSAP